MTDRNWDAELAKIDRKLTSMSDEELVQRAQPPSAAGDAGAAPPARRAGAGAPARASGAAPSTLGVALRVGLGVVLAVGIGFWPYAAQCGLSLTGYLAAIVALIAAGTWGAVATWRARAARLHMVTLGVVAWGASLLAVEILPRIGYAVDASRAAWLCQ